MNKLKSLLILTLVLVSCGGEATPTTGSFDESTTITWSWYANDIELEVQCEEEWICNENYGGSIAYTQPFATMEYVTKLGSIDELMLEQEDFFLEDGTFFDSYEWREDSMATVIKDDYDGLIWFTYMAMEGLEEGRHLKCEAYFEDSIGYLELLDDVEKMCEATKVL